MLILLVIYASIESMKVFPFKIPKPKNEALVYQEEIGMAFYDQLHQHAEIQISYIVKGRGALIVGDAINEYRENDILVIGGYLPHVFKSDTSASTESLMYTLFFDKKSFGRDFFDIQDLSSSKDFFTRAEFGMKILSNTSKIKTIFEALSQQNKMEQIASLLMVISSITKARSQPLSSFVYRKTYSDDEGKRLGEVFKYTMERFQTPISLDEIAGVAHMSKNAFCRYFKKRTNKTFFQFLIEIRIENACKQLLNNPDHSVFTLAEACGFRNVAHFNRKFKEIKGLTPSQYRAKNNSRNW